MVNNFIETDIGSFCHIGFENPGAVGSDPVQLLSAALKRQGMNAQVKISGLPVFCSTSKAVGSWYHFIYF